MRGFGLGLLAGYLWCKWQQKKLKQALQADTQEYLQAAHKFERAAQNYEETRVRVVRLLFAASIERNIATLEAKEEPKDPSTLS